jgi:Glycosyl transferase family 2
MFEASGSPSAARRLFAALARLGIDLRPIMRRARDAILRPVRHELTVGTGALREQLDAHIAAMAARLGAETTNHEALERQLAEISSRLGAETTNRETLERQLAEMSSRLGTETTNREALERQLAEVSSRLGTASEAHRNLATDVAGITGRIEAERSERRARLSLLETLVTESYRPVSPRTAQFLHDNPSPIVSVILPTRDRARFVGEAIASVQAQSFRDWELIIIDDGSKDDTAAAVAPYLADARIRYVQQQARGASDARNHGLSLARGAFIAYIDSDNFWYRHFLASAVNELASDPTTDVIYGALVTDAPHLDGTRLMLVPFDRDLLMSANYIDMNVIVHRRNLVERYGGFDDQVSRVNDWDLILRYTEHVPARPVPILAARYRVCDDIRLTVTQPFGSEVFKIRRKWYPPATAARKPRVLYVLWQYPQLSETYIEGEIRCMLRWGADVEVWREKKPQSPYTPSVPVHDGSLADAVRCVQPDVIHVHWLGYVTQREELLGKLGVPVTLRLHGFDTTPEDCRAILEKPWILAVYGFPLHVEAVNREHPRLRAVPAAFDSTLFRPFAEKDRRLVLRTCAALPSKDIPLFFEVANRLPEYRFVLSAVTCTHGENYADMLRDLRRQMNSPCELMFDVQHEDLVPLVEQAGIYLHTVKPPGTEHATPIGMPVSIAEAMATGAHVLVRDLPELGAYVAEAGTIYRDADHAAAIIASTAQWPEQRWKTGWMASVDRAFLNHADEIALRPIFEDWCSLVERGGTRR